MYTKTMVLPHDPEKYVEGLVLLIDKPLEWTSFDVVNKLRIWLKYRLGLKKIKVGHAGTLDPLATGLLIICVGKATKMIEDYQSQIKSYSGTFALGSTTPSYDRETEIDFTFPTDHIDDNMIQNAKLEFIGEIQQMPPVYSAIKVEGKAAYKTAHKGKTLEMKTRLVTISKFEVERFSENEMSFEVVCSKGTYIRSLAYDMGKALQTGAYLSSLVRTSIGEYQNDDAYSIEDLEIFFDQFYQK